MNSDAFILKRLEWPDHPVDVVLDTDTFNEVDDQFALAYLVASQDKLRIRGIFAAPFFNDKATSPADGMEKSYREIANVLTLCGRSDLLPLVFRGSETYLPDEKTPVESPAARELVRLAMERPDDDPLYVIAIGAISNVASALLIEPRIAEKIVVVWLGGNGHHWPHTYEFNMMQDVAGARVLMQSGAPLVQLPCMGVVTHLHTTGPELAHWLRGKNALCDYLCDIVFHDEEEVRGRVLWNRVIWDVSAVAWVLNEGFTAVRTVHAAIPTYDHHYDFRDDTPLIKYVYMVHRDPIFADLFAKLASFGDPQ